MATTLTFFTRTGGRSKWRADVVRWTLAAATAIVAAVALLVPPLIVTTVTAPEAGVLARADRDAARSDAAGVFTGEYADGVPVYRLPPLSIVGERPTSIAAVARDAESN